MTPGADLDAASSSLAQALALTPALAMEQPTAGAEPNIAILPDGTIFITAVAGSQERPNHEQGAAWLWRSTDGGATFETLRAPVRDTSLGSVPGTRRPFGSSDADVVASPDGWIYYTDWWNYGAPVVPPVGLPVPLPVNPFARYGSYLVERSADGGATWESTSVTTLDTFGGMDRQWLVAGPDGWVGLFYAYFHGPNPSRPTETPDALAGYSSIQAVYSTDHGATWTDPAPVVGPTNEGFSQIAHPDLAADGLLWMPHGYTANGETFWTDPSEVRVALSEDLGQTWTDIKIVDVPRGFDNLWAVQGASEPDGTLHVAWAARTNDTLTVFHAQSVDRGQTWSAPDALRADGTSFLPWVAATAGEVAVSWYGSEVTGDPSEAADDAQWRLHVAVRRDGVWRNTTTEPVKIGPMCGKGASCAGNRELLDYAGLAFAPDGALHTTFATSREVNGVNAGLVNYAARVVER
ncbi:MAG: sialidase family protein [Ilumatobacteraceae bacterium]